MLDLESNDFTPNGICELADALGANDALERLKLGHNNVGPVGARCIGDALKVDEPNQGNRKGLTHLYLPESGIGTEGAKSLAQALHSNSRLKHLDLSYNNFDFEGVKELAEALHNNTGLETLELNEVGLTENGVRLLAEALVHNTRLATFNLAGNDLTPAGLAALVNALKVNAMLRTDLFDSDLSEFDDDGGMCHQTFTRVHQARGREQGPCPGIGGKHIEPGCSTTCATQCPARSVAEPSKSASNYTVCRACGDSPVVCEEKCDGMFWEERTGECVCAAGRYSTTREAGYCMECDVGQYQEGTGKTQCLDCASGMACPNGVRGVP